jgi:hypothetical protein
MLVDDTQGRLKEIKRFILDNPQYRDSFQTCMDTLKRINKNYPEYDCLLIRDFAPYSMEFVFRSKATPSDLLLRGGVIFHGNPDESLSVQLVPFEGFSIHT